MKRKLSNINITILVISAIFFDLLNVIPLFNIVVSAISTFSFQTYFFMKGVKKSHYSLIGNLIEFIPGLNLLPAITAGVIMTTVTNRAEEKLAEKAAQEKKMAEEKALAQKVIAKRQLDAAILQRQQREQEEEMLEGEVLVQKVVEKRQFDAAAVQKIVEKRQLDAVMMQKVTAKRMFDATIGHKRRAQEQILNLKK